MKLSKLQKAEILNILENKIVIISASNLFTFNEKIKMYALLNNLKEELLQ